MWKCSSKDYLGVILEPLRFFSKSVLNGGSGGPLKVLSLDARRTKCSKLRSRSALVNPNAQECVLARRPSIQMRVRCVEMRSRSTPADPNACPKCSDVLSLNVRESKCVFDMLKCSLARRESFQMRVLGAQMRSRSTLVVPNVFSMCSGALSLDACPSKCVSQIFRCILARRPSLVLRHFVTFGYVFCPDPKRVGELPGLGGGRSPWTSTHRANVTCTVASGFRCPWTSTCQRICKSFSWYSAFVWTLARCVQARVGYHRRAAWSRAKRGDRQRAPPSFNLNEFRNH